MEWSFEVNTKKVKHLEKYQNLNKRENKYFVIRCLFFPIILIPLLVSCQSSINSNLYLVSENSSLAYTNKEENNSKKLDALPPNLTFNQINSNKTSKSNKSQTNSTKTNSSTKKVLTYAPPVQTQPEDDMNLNLNDNNVLLPSDELDNNDNLTSSSTDASSSTNESINNNLLTNTIPSSLPTDNLLLCEDNTYYESWKTQFDNQWLAENSHDYKTPAARNKALAQARTNEFIKIVYPSIEKTGFDFPVVINNQVLQWVNYFRTSGKRSFATWLSRGQYVIPEMEKTLEKFGLPKDLVYLSMIESGYNPKALSYVGAVGPWQFMPATAKENGLKINDFIDERRDFKKSTVAAANYLSALYAQFGSWHLAAASYNGGPGLVRKTLRNYGTDSSFFQLTSMGVVNKETADYVPKLIAAMIISKNPEKFGFDLKDATLPSQSKTIALTRSITIADLAKSLNIDKGVLEVLNPELRLGITPPPHATSEGVFELKIPSSKYDAALLALNSIPNASSNYLIATRIKRRETLAAFISRYQLNTAAVLNANINLKKNSHLHKGQLIYISVSLGSGQYDKLINNKIATNKKTLAKHSTLSQSPLQKHKKSYLSSIQKHSKTSSSFHKKSKSYNKVAVSEQRKHNRNSKN